jgi:hypothetical protein
LGAKVIKGGIPFRRLKGGSAKLKRQAWQKMPSPIFENGKTCRVGFFLRGGVREWLGFFRGDIWVKPTEVAGVAEEAHRRWPKGRSEQDARKAKVDSPRICALPRGSCSGVSVSAGGARIRASGL